MDAQTIGDNYVPADQIIVKVGELFEANKNYVTRFTCSGYRTMTFEQFKEEVVPTLKDVSGRIEAVSVAEEGFTARLNAAGDIVIDYSGDAYDAKNLNIGTLTLTVKAKENQGGTTGLENIQHSDVDVQKFFRNGVMYIRRGETIYGLDGKKIE